MNMLLKNLTTCIFNTWTSATQHWYYF